MPQDQCICGGTGWDGCEPERPNAALAQLVYEETLEELSKVPGGPGAVARYREALDKVAPDGPRLPAEVIEGHGREVPERPAPDRTTEEAVARPALRPPDSEGQDLIDGITENVTKPVARKEETDGIN